MLTDKEFEYTKALAIYFADKTKNGIPPGQFNAIFAQAKEYAARYVEERGRIQAAKDKIAQGSKIITIDFKGRRFIG